MRQADVLITVAGVPPVGVDRRAAVAGITTMQEDCPFEDRDLETRRAGEDRHAEFGRRPEPMARARWTGDDRGRRAGERSGGTRGLFAENGVAKPSKRSAPS